MQTRSGHPFRGQFPYGDSGLGTGGNQVTNAQTGSIAGGVGQWHPTVIYLLILLVIEWAVFLFINKFI